MEEKKKEIGKIVRAIVFSDKDAPEEYVLEEKLRIPVGGEFVEKIGRASCRERVSS